MIKKVIVELKLQDSNGDEIINLFCGVFPSTRTYDGGQLIDVSIGKVDATTVVITDQGGSEKKHQNYVLFRTNAGTNAEIEENMAAEPRILYYDVTDA